MAGLLFPMPLVVHRSLLDLRTRQITSQQHPCPGLLPRYKSNINTAYTYQRLRKNKFIIETKAMR